MSSLCVGSPPTVQGKKEKIICTTVCKKDKIYNVEKKKE